MKPFTFSFNQVENLPCFLPGECHLSRCVSQADLVSCFAGEGLVLGSTNLLGVGAPNVLYKLHEFQPHGN